MAAAAPDFGPFLEQARAFVMRFRVGDGPLDGRFRSARGGEPDLYGAADAAYALWILGALEELADAPGRRAWAERIRGFQDPASGWFEGPRLPGHGRAHATAFAVGALVLLGSRPAHPLRYAESLFSSPEAIEVWLDRLRWSQIWTGSHAAGAAAAVLDAPDGVALPPVWTDWLLDALDARVDSATGFWKRALHDRVWRRPTTLDLGGAAHFWWLYDRLGRAIPRPAAVLEGILGLQRRAGWWGSRIFGGAHPQGIDLDALHGLRVAWRDAGEDARRECRPRIAAALERYARAAHAVLTPPGAVERRFRAPHKLVGTLNALAELDAASAHVLGRRCTAGGAALRSSLARVCWQ